MLRSAVMHLSVQCALFLFIPDSFFFLIMIQSCHKRKEISCLWSFHICSLCALGFVLVELDDERYNI